MAMCVLSNKIRRFDFPYAALPMHPAVQDQPVLPGETVTIPWMATNVVPEMIVGRCIPDPQTARYTSARRGPCVYHAAKVRPPR